MAYPGPSQFIQFLATWTAALIDVAPNWMQQRPNALNGAKFLYALILPIDVTVENTLQAINDWAPGSPDASITALPLIGQSRGLIQGEAETSAQFGVRLQNWRAVTKQTGKTELLAQAIQRYLGNNPLVRVVERIANAAVVTTTADFIQQNVGTGTTVAVTSTASILAPGAAYADTPLAGSVNGELTPLGSYSVSAVVDGTHATIVNLGGSGIAPGATVPKGTTLTYATTGAPQARYVTANTDGTTATAIANWDWDSVLGWTDDQQTWSGPQCRLFWSDLWIVVYPGEWSIAGLIAPLTGQRVPAVAHDAILGLVAQWKGAFTFVRAIIYSYNVALFDPASPGTAGNPNGQWGNWAWVDGGGNAVPARTLTNVRYWIPPRG